MQVQIKSPYLLFLGDEPEVSHAKTAVGIAHWRPDSCVAQLRLPGSGVTACRCSGMNCLFERRRNAQSMWSF